MGMGHARAVFLGLILFLPPQAFSAVPSGRLQNATAFEAASIGSIARWLKRDGRDGWLGADVADAVGIPRLAFEDLLEAKQRGFEDDEALRIVQVSADERRDFLLFMVQRHDGRVFFYVASVREGLKGAYVSDKGSVTSLDRMDAEPAFQRELRFWEGRVAVR